MNNTLTALPTEELFKRHPELERLLSILQHNKDFGLYFARCNVPIYRKQLVAILIERYSCPIIEVSLNQLEANLETTTLDVALAEYLQNQPHDATIFFYDLEMWLPSKDIEVQHHTLQKINWQRSVYARLQRHVVIWLPDYALKIVARSTPDFLDRESGIYEFDVPKSQRANFIIQSPNTSDEEGTHAEDRMSVAEKRRWMNMLVSLREETQSDTLTGKQSLANLLNDLGRLHRSLGEYEQALDYYQCARSYCLDIADRNGEGKLLNEISSIYHAQGDYKTALEYLQQSLDISKETGDRKFEGETLNNISRIFEAQNDYDSALDYLQQALDIRIAIGDKVGEGKTLNNISQIFKMRGDYEAALDYLQNALNIRQEIGNQAGEGATLNNISSLYYARGDYEVALEYLQQSLKVSRSISDKAGEGTTLNNISQIFKVRGDYEVALDYLQQSQNLFQEIGDRASLCVILFNIGYIYWAKDNEAEAKAQWISAYKIAKHIHYVQVLDALEELGKQLGGKGLETWEKIV